ncbi:MAG TPA: TonB-dependent receptor [Vicinamibacterales bacterium]|nr:TonB-dependent receptor [Vicinamibacterales bacterium]
MFRGLRFRAFAVVAAIALLGGAAGAQTPTGTITGRITDADNLPVPGATVTIASPHLQGTRSAVTSGNGDYIFPGLPPGTYTVTVELSGFATTRLTRDVGVGQPVQLDVTLRPAAVSEVVTVTARTDAYTNTVQASTNIRQELLLTLPTARTLLSAVNVAPAAHATGPNNAITIGGAMSADNLFMLDGVQIQDNIRGTPFTLFIEDAIQETTVSTSGISAEYGRFTGGVINAITRSGGNEFSGSLRTTFNNDDWRTTSPFDEPKKDDTVPTYEFTLGGPVLRNRTWFFAAGRFFDQSQANETGYTRAAYTFENDEKRLEGKITQGLGQGHNLRGAYTAVRETEVNNVWPSPQEVMDLRSLHTRQLPQDLLSIHYTGVLQSNFFVEAQYSARQFAFENSGGTSRDLVDGTVLRSQQTGAFWWSPNFCGVCGPEDRDNDNLFVKGTYFWSTGRGSHNMVFGYDTFNDRRKGDNHQSGSDFQVWTTDTIVQDGTVYPVAAGNGSTYIINYPINQASRGTNFRTHSLFFNDSWNAGDHFTFNLGVRWDRNDGVDAAGNQVADDSALSPRLGVVWDPRGNGTWSVHASYGRYVAALANTIADSASPAGTPSIIAWFYQGPGINTAADAPLVTSDQALRQIFSWFDAGGGTSRPPFFTRIPGIQKQIRESLLSPNANEFSTGVSRQLGQRGALRADVVYRDFSDFYADRIDTTTGQVTDPAGQIFDLALVENSNLLERQYAAMSLQANYRAGSRVDLGGNYTLSRLWGNVNGETVNSGPVTSTVTSYPEYFDLSWSAPDGALAADQRHRIRLWGTARLPVPERFGRLTLALFEQINSGTPYGALGSVDSRSYVPNPGYRTPPATVNYWFTDRDAFHTEAMVRTDFSLNYDYPLAGRARLFGQLQVLNLFNQFQLFNINSNAIDTAVLTAVDDPDRFESFNPFAERPVQGVHWDYGDQFGEPVGAAAYTLPRTLQFALGIRF